MNREEKSHGKEEKRLIYMYTSTSKIQVTKKMAEDFTLMSSSQTT
jgi:hypothetical protein